VNGRRRLAILLVALAAAFATSCSEDQPDPPVGARHVAIETEDGERLDAIELGRGTDVVVMSHGATGTKEDFYGLASAFARDGWRVLDYDARGVGDSTGSLGDRRDVDLRAVVEHARETGARRIVLAGGSLGASLSISMASELRADALVSLSAPASTFGALDAARALGGTIPVFVAAAVDNEPFASDARAIAGALGEEPTIVTGDGHGTGMFKDHPALIDAIVRWTDRAVGHQG
jgi:pimeloyl-ACP methyl ester carboxylesterase